MCKGFVKIPKRLFDTRWWNQKRVYSESDAIIDLYHCADKNSITVSLRSLADKWLWNQVKVMRLLNKLQKDGYLSIETTDIGTTIKVIDFGASVTSVTPSVTPRKKKCNTEMPINKGLFDNECNTSGVTPVTPSVTPSRARFDNILLSDNIDNNNINNNINNINNNISILFDDEFSFNKFWDLYDKKVGKDTAEKLYAKLSLKDRQAIFDYIPKYKLAQPNKKYRQDPARFLRNHSWRDEIIDGSSSSGTRLKDNSIDKFKEGFSW